LLVPDHFKFADLYEWCSLRLHILSIARLFSFELTDLLDQLQLLYDLVLKSLLEAVQFIS